MSITAIVYPSLNEFNMSFISSNCLRMNGLTITLFSLVSAEFKSISTYSSSDSVPKIFFKLNAILFIRVITSI